MFELDLPNLPYLQAIIKENFRLHLVVPLAVPHLTSKDTQILNYKILANIILYIKATVFVCLSVWAVPGRFFHSLPVPCGTSPDVTDSREKRNQGQSDFLRQKIW